jgi:hypothetical protein
VTHTEGGGLSHTGVGGLSHTAFVVHEGLKNCEGASVMDAPSCVV